MKVAGLFLLFSRFIIVAGACMLLPPASARGTFAIAGIVIQFVGLFLMFRAHYTPGEGH